MGGTGGAAGFRKDWIVGGATGLAGGWVTGGGGAVGGAAAGKGAVEEVTRGLTDREGLVGGAEGRGVPICVVTGGVATRVEVTGTGALATPTWPSILTATCSGCLLGSTNT